MSLIQEGEDSLRASCSFLVNSTVLGCRLTICNVRAVEDACIEEYLSREDPVTVLVVLPGGVYMVTGVAGMEEGGDLVVISDLTYLAPQEILLSNGLTTTMG